MSRTTGRPTLLRPCRAGAAKPAGAAPNESVEGERPAATLPGGSASPDVGAVPAPTSGEADPPGR
eukprot:4633197-Pyramimonas_sp.AAC.1